MSIYIDGKQLVTSDMIGGQYARGGENLLPGTMFKSIDDLSSKGWSVSSGISISNNSIIIDADSNNDEEIKFTVWFEYGYNYVFSLQMVYMTGNATGAKFFMVEKDKDGTNCPIYTDHRTILANTYNRKDNIFNLSPVNSNCRKAQLVIRANPGTKFQFKLPKFEAGTVPTIWTPSPADF